jgi:hypothetical protein
LIELMVLGIAALTPTLAQREREKTREQLPHGACAKASSIRRNALRLLRPTRLARTIAEFVEFDGPAFLEVIIRG